MIIEIGKYTIEPEAAGVNQWNVFKHGTTKDGTKPTNVNIAWGVKLPQAIEIIVADKNIDNPTKVTLYDYMVVYLRIYNVMVAHIIALTEELKQQGL